MSETRQLRICTDPYECVVQLSMHERHLRMPRVFSQRSEAKGESIRPWYSI